MRQLKIVAVLAGVLLYSLPLLAGDTHLTGDLNLVITGFKSNAGMARIQVMDSEQAIVNEGKSVCLIKSRVMNGKVEITLKAIPYGRYAVAVFHDTNGNGVLDKKLMGVPKEEYGYSNNVRGKLGPGSFEKIQFDLTEPAVTQQIILN